MGLIDEVALYDWALTLSEIEDQYDAGSAENRITSLRHETIAKLGEDQTVIAGTTLTLDGTCCTDSIGDTIIVYLWEETCSALPIDVYCN